MQRKFTALNGLRIFAALSVVCFHYATLAASFKVLPRFTQNLIENGTIALPFFYVLSGFVLTHAYSNRGPARIQKRGFYNARVARLFPAYVVAFVLFGILAGIDAGFALSLKGSRLDRLFTDSRFGASMQIAYQSQIARVPGVAAAALAPGASHAAGF